MQWGDFCGVNILLTGALRGSTPCTVRLLIRADCVFAGFPLGKYPLLAKSAAAEDFPEMKSRVLIDRGFIDLGS